MAAPAKSSPKDAQVMTAILKEIGVTDFEPRVINQMLEFAYRYVTDVLDDAKVYSQHANKKDLDKDDVKLAIQSKMDHTFTTPPPRELLMDVARQKNSQPLPLIRTYSGLRLPPDRYCLSAPNYKLKTLRKLTKSVGKTTRAPVGTSMAQNTAPTPRFSIATKQAPLRPTLTLQHPGPPSTVVSKTFTPTLPGVTKPIARVNSAGSSNSSSLSSVTDSSASSAANPLKRKLDDSEDYDN